MSISIHRLLAASLTAMAVLGFSATAEAIPIHHHVTVHKDVLVPRADRAGKREVEITVHRVEKYDVAPAYVPPPVPASTPTSSYAPTTSAPSGGYSIPSYIVQCESGGSYTAQNASGAYGAYQIMPSTATNYGCNLSTPAGQDSCAAAIYADVGPSAWSCG